MATTKQRLAEIVCVCGQSDTAPIGTDAARRFTAAGWKHITLAGGTGDRNGWITNSGADMGGICPECQELEDE